MPQQNRGYNGRSAGTSLWIPPLPAGKKQIPKSDSQFIKRPNRSHAGTLDLCNFKLDAKTVWLKRAKKNGEPYMLKVLVGDPCGRPACVISRDPETAEAVRRCGGHVHEPVQRA